MSVATDVRNKVSKRLTELEPLVQEYEELQRVARALKGEMPETVGARAAPTVPGVER